MRALSAGEASLFVYPLRALIADQAFHLSSAFDRFGITCAVLNGETAPEERARVYERLAEGTLDIVLTTPEYLCCHVDEIAASRRIGLITSGWRRRGSAWLTRAWAWPSRAWGIRPCWR